MKKILIKSRCNNELTLDSQCYALIRLIRPERNRCVMRWMEAVNVLAYWSQQKWRKVMWFEVKMFINVRSLDDSIDSDKAEGWRRCIFACEVKMIIDDEPMIKINILMMFLAPYRLPLASFLMMNFFSPTTMSLITTWRTFLNATLYTYLQQHANHVLFSSRKLFLYTAISSATGLYTIEQTESNWVLYSQHVSIGNLSCFPLLFPFAFNYFSNGAALRRRFVEEKFYSMLECCNRSVNSLRRENSWPEQTNMESKAKRRTIAADVDYSWAVLSTFVTFIGPKIFVCAQFRVKL